MRRAVSQIRRLVLAKTSSGKPYIKKIGIKKVEDWKIKPIFDEKQFQKGFLIWGNKAPKLHSYSTEEFIKR